MPDTPTGDALPPDVGAAIARLAAGLPPQELQAVVAQLLTAAGVEDLQRPPPSRAPHEGPALHPRRADAVTYRVRVDLADVRPPVWRRLELASDLPLPALHAVLQAALGWTDSHLHRFALGGPLFSRGTREFPTALDLEEGDDEGGPPEAEVRLDEVLTDVGDVLHYGYDFGDGWDHTVRLEEVLPRPPGTAAARVTGGRRACPPEDVGGAWGYQQLVDAVAARDAGAALDPELDERLAWAGPFDPERFDVAEAQAAVEAALRQPDLSGAPPAVLELALRAQGPGAAAVARLVDAADLTAGPGAEVLDDDAVVAAVRPWTVLLGVVGADGVQLTGRGYLPPQAVRTLLDELDPDWVGTGTREWHTPPVLTFREDAQALGLVRRHRGRLVRTPAGRRGYGDPRALMEQLTSRLPLGKERYEQDAGLLALLAVAGGRSPAEAAPLLGGAMDALGWSVDGAPVRGHHVESLTRRTTDVLHHLGALVPPAGGRRFLEPDVVGPTGAAVARAALRG